MEHIGMGKHDGYKEHSHEVRSDHLGVEQDPSENTHEGKPDEQQAPRQVSTDQLNLLYWNVEDLVNIEGQDRTMVIEMSQHMLNDLIEHGDFQKPIEEYVHHYSTVDDDGREIGNLTAIQHSDGEGLTISQSTIDDVRRVQENRDAGLYDEDGS